MSWGAAFWLQDVGFCFLGQRLRTVRACLDELKDRAAQRALMTFMTNSRSSEDRGRVWHCMAVSIC